MLGSLVEMSLEENRQVFTPEANTPGETEHFFPQEKSGGVILTGEPISLGGKKRVLFLT
jgi:hypothetical protein